MPSEVMCEREFAHSKLRSTSEYQMPAIGVPSPTGGSLTFLKKLWKDKRADKRYDSAEESNSPSPSLFRRNSSSTKRLSQQSNLLNIISDSQQQRSRSPSPSRFKALGRRLSASNEKTNENLLHYYVSHHDYTSLEKVLSNPNDFIDVNILRPPGITALHEACVLGNLKIVKLLVQKGADVRLKTLTGLSPLQVAVMSGCYDIAQYLVSVGANSDDIKNGFQIEKFNNRSRSF